MRNLLLIFSFIFSLLSFKAKSAEITIQFPGLIEGDIVNLSISSNEYLNTLEVSKDGDHIFKNIPEGKYGVKIEASGYYIPETQLVNVDGNGNVYPPRALMIPIKKSRRSQ